MTGQSVTAEAQWALHGDATGRDENRVLACSTGELNATNFNDAIGRFDPGATGALPQVTVSYLTPATEPGESLVAMAIHAHRPEERDEGGRSTVTSYFCVPYHRLASAGVTYRGMHDALRAIRLPADNGPPLTVTMPGTGPGTPAVDDLALRSAALLLTGRPVCVLGAEEVSLADRLAFIDTVMTLLPYGLRARMAAATWTPAAYRDRRFRLYFSDAERADPPDHVLRWGDPGIQARIDNHAARYLNWLEGAVSQPTAQLAELTEPIRFNPASILQMLDSIGIASQDNPSLNYSVTGQDWLLPTPAPPTGAGLGDGAPVLRAFAELVQKGDSRAIKSDIGKLIRLARADDEQKSHYREIIKETKLLARTEDLPRIAGKLYEHLLRAAFVVPLSYEGYRQVEDCLGGAPRPALHQAIESVGMADPWVKAIVHWSLRAAKGRAPLKESGRQKLNKWYGSGEVNVADFIHELSGDWKHPPNARIICEVILDFLKQQPKGYEPGALRDALSRHGFLAHALQANQIGGNATYRADALRKLLTAAYPDGLDQQAIIQILAGEHAPPTASLLAAVLMLAKPDDVWLAPPAYLRGSIRAMDLNEQTRGILKPLLQPLLLGPFPARLPEGGHG